MVMTRAQLIEQNRYLLNEISDRLIPIVNYMPRIENLVRENIRLEHSATAARLELEQYKNHIIGGYRYTIADLTSTNKKLRQKIQELERLRDDIQSVKKRRVKKSKVSKPTFK